MSESTVSYQSELMKSPPSGDSPGGLFMAPACISAISGRCGFTKGIQDEYVGEDIFIHKNYVELKPYNPEMNTAIKPFNGFKPHKEKTFREKSIKHQLHFDYRANELPDHFKPVIAGKLIKSGRSIHGKIQNINPVHVPTAKLAAHHHAESHLYVRNKSNDSHLREKRGIITKVSKKSSIRLKKFLASITDLGLWIDFTFPDDVMSNKTLAERRDFATECLKKLKRYIHSLGLKEIWKKEFTARKSGKLKGLHVPHYHIAIAGLTRHQEKIWQSLCIQILYKWVDIIGSDDDNAVVVACHRKSFRKIHCSKQAISYIGKYFSKTNEVEDETGEVISIGRAWGYAKALKDEIPDPHHLFLTRDQSIKFRRFVRKYKRLKPNKDGFIGVQEQVIKGFSTFLFADDNTLIRFLMSIGVDVLMKDGVPF